MTGLAKAHGLLSVGLLLLLPAVAVAQDITAKVTPELGATKSVALSESLRVTLTIEGPAPLRVELPKPLLIAESDRDWKIRPAGPVSVTPLAGTRERWSQTFRLEPFVAGESLLVQFAPTKVNGREIDGPWFEVKVTSTVTEVKAEAARPVTPIEELPPPPGLPTESVAAWVWAMGAILVLLVAVAVWRLRGKPAQPSPAEWAAAAFAQLDRDGVSGVALIERATAILREYIERRFGIPATTLTTAELLAASEQAVWPVEKADALRAILGHGDVARFAGVVPDDRGCRRLAATIRDWVHDVSTITAGPG